ncbi:MAG: PIG-L family deacetylase [Bryobacteraceae bacterium]|nr:PIG-L family deacetylase [Bryobacteraceae bacterium]
MIVAAHPDDEVLALGGHFRTVHPRIFHLTNGAGFLPIPSLAHRRAEEVKKALAMGGIASRSFSAGVVPDQGVAAAIPALVQRLKAFTDRVRADCMVTHSFEGGHPDHDAASVICQLVGQGRMPIYEFTSYHNATPYSPQSSLRTNQFLRLVTPEMTVLLSERQRRLKQRMLKCFRSQAEFLGRFSITEERFRIAPRYCYAKPPHEGTLLYESFGWRINYLAWWSAVESALKEMGVSLHV